jgi:hypothetical protein
MTDPDNKEVPTLEDELLESIGTSESAAAAEAGRPPAWLPAWLFGGQALQPPWEDGQAPDWWDIATMTAGFGAFLLFDAIVMYAPLRMTDPPSTLPQAIALFLIALGLGGGLIRFGEGRWRTFGLGLAGGWVLVTLLSAGLFTGLRG